MLNKLKFIILKPITLSIILGGIIIIFLPDYFNSHLIERIPLNIKEGTPQKMIHPADMDGDGSDEFIITYKYQDQHSIQICKFDGGIIDQWNTKVNMPNYPLRIGTGDYDNDGFGEFYSFGDRDDTLFLYAYEPLDTINPLFLNNIPLLKLSRKYNNPDYIFNHIEIRDLTNDGYNDLFFIINSGQARIPRNLCLYDIVNDTLIISPTYGTVPSESINFINRIDDGELCIFGNTQAAGQTNDSLGIPYSDYSAWLMMFNDKLSLTFEPIEFSGFRSNIRTQHVILNGVDYILALYNHQGYNDNYPELLLLDFNGKVHRNYKFHKSTKIERWINMDKKTDPESFFVVSTDGKIIEFDSTLRPVDSMNLDVIIRNNYLISELNIDGTPEKIFVLDNGNLLITRDDFSLPVEYESNEKIRFVDRAIIEDKNYIFVQTSDNEFLLKYSKNPIYIFKYAIYLGIIFLMYLFIIIIRKLQLIQIQKRENIRKQIFELQLKGLRNQMDPHFTLNVFNTIAYKIHKESPESYDAFMEFSNLIRKTLLASDSITRPIADEISKLESYLKLEQMRYGDKISYEIVMDNEIDQNTPIPKLLLQTYVENAIKHGIRPKAGPGKVTIRLYLREKNLIIEISDNGIGRKKSKELKTQGTGFGLKIMENYIALFNETNRSKIRQRIIDIDNGINTGTTVEITIPIDYTYSNKKT